MTYLKEVLRKLATEQSVRQSSVAGTSSIHKAMKVIEEVDHSARDNSFSGSSSAFRGRDAVSSKRSTSNTPGLRGMTRNE